MADSASTPADPSAVHRVVEAVWRMESGRVIAGLTRIVGEVGTAEELAADAVVAALEQWPRDGVPDNPGAWLMATARHRAVDQIRRRVRYSEKLRQLAGGWAGEGGKEVIGASEAEEPDFAADVDDHVRDDLLRLIFMACHPTLGVSSRVALTLRLLGGLSTEETARALLVSEATVAQRIVRAKKALTGVRFDLPAAAELADRLASVLEVIYLIFNEGYSATVGDDWTRPALCDEALRLGRVLAGLAPVEPEVHGLLALMEIQASRLRARSGPGGEPVLLAEQDRRAWDRLLIRRGLAALAEAERLCGGTAYLGPYGLQASIAACHARARTVADTDWGRIAALYRLLGIVSPSPVVELNRAVAVGMSEGPAAGLAIVDTLRGDRALVGYPQLPAVRGDLLARLGDRDQARAEFEHAAVLTRNESERSLFLRRCAELAP
jgi:RNA polymerase sigma factor (sigma-70 family)